MQFEAYATQIIETPRIITKIVDGDGIFGKRHTCLPK